LAYSLIILLSPVFCQRALNTKVQYNYNKVGGQDEKYNKKDKTTAEIAGKYQVYPTQVRKWKRIVLDSLPLLFKENNQQKEKDRLIEELDWYSFKIALL